MSIFHVRHHLLFHQFFTPLILWGSEGSWSRSIWHSVASGVHPGQVASVSQDQDTETNGQPRSHSHLQTSDLTTPIHVFGKWEDFKVPRENRCIQKWKLHTKNTRSNRVWAFLLWKTVSYTIYSSIHLLEFPKFCWLPCSRAKSNKHNQQREVVAVWCALWATTESMWPACEANNKNMFKTKSCVDFKVFKVSEELHRRSCVLLNLKNVRTLTIVLCYPWNGSGITKQAYESRNLTLGYVFYCSRTSDKLQDRAVTSCCKHAESATLSWNCLSRWCCCKPLNTSLRLVKGKC